MDSQSMADFSPQFGVPNQGVSHLHKNNSFTSLWDSLGVVFPPELTGVFVVTPLTRHSPHGHHAQDSLGIPSSFGNIP
jgi:hypothetical protein